MLADCALDPAPGLVPVPLRGLGVVVVVVVVVVVPTMLLRGHHSE